LDTIASTPAWVGFAALLVGALATDLTVHRDAHEIGFREALAWSVVWIVLALAFNVFVDRTFGRNAALQFLAGYLVEKALSVDNIFVFVVLFEAFAVPRRLQHRVLFWGILGAVLMRAAFIFAGAALLSQFHWVMYVFGAVLMLTGIRLLARRDSSLDPRQNPLYRMFTRLVPTSSDFVGDRFIAIERGQPTATPLLGALVAIEAVDVVFAIDSIPAIFAITRDPFLVLTSNIFAILGLRAMFFMVGGAVTRFRHLNAGLADRKSVV